LAILARAEGDSESPRRKSSDAGNTRALSVDVDIRLTGKGLAITRAQAAAVLAGLAGFVCWLLILRQ
jgi:hypothetical protein